MIVMGIDPGTSRSGYGIIRSVRDKLIHVAHGTIRTDSRRPLAERLASLHWGIMEVMERYSPQCVAVEAIFHAKNPRSSLMLGHARGVLLLAVVQKGIEVREYSPLSIKLAITGYGRADKRQIRSMVQALLHVDSGLSLDAADALAVAICHVHHLGGAFSRMVEQGHGWPSGVTE
jgi:crossover junction endodeoxyribonuclease RuvC